jgi:head-tail adaptor
MAKRFTIGDFDRRVTFQERTSGRVNGFKKATFVNYHTEWAFIDYETGGTDEAFNAARKTATESAVFYIRLNTLTQAITPAFKLIDNSTGKTWDIRSIHEHRETGRNMYLKITAEQKGPDNE